MAEIDDIVVKLQSDTSEVEKDLKDFKDKKAPKAGKEAGQKFGSGFAQGFKAVASVAIVGVVGKFLTQATRDALKFEEAFLGLDATAKQFGQSTEEARKAVKALARDGTLGIKETSTALKLALQTTNDLGKSKGLVQAVKQIASLNRITGTTGEATEAFFKSILTGSNDLLENADPALRSLALQVGGLGKITKDATARQEFFNLVIQRGADLQDGYTNFLNSAVGATQRFEAESEKLSASVGDALLPIVAKVNTVLADLFMNIREGLESLSGVSQSFVIIGGSLTAVFLGLSVVLGPIGLILAAITLSVTALVTVFNELSPSASAIVEEVKAQAKELNKLEKETLKSVKAGKKYIDSQSDLAKAAEAAGIAIRSETGALREQLDVLADFKKITEANLIIQQQSLIASRAQIQLRVDAIPAGGFVPEVDKIALKNLNDAIDEIQNSLNDLIDPSELVNKSVTNTFNNVTKSAKKAANFLDSQFVRSLKKLRQQFVEFLKATRDPELRAQGGAVFAKRNEQLISQQKMLILEFLDEKLEAELLGIDRSKQAALDALTDLHRQGLISTKKFERDKEKIEAQANLKKTRAALRITEQKIGGISEVFTAGTIGGRLGGIGAIAGGEAGEIFGAAGGIIDSISTVFGALFGGLSDLEKQILERQKQERAIAELVELQTKFAKELLELQNQRSKLLSAEADRQIKLNNLLITGDANRAKANLQVIKDLAEVRAGEIGIAGSDPTAVAEFITNKERGVLADTFLKNIIDGVVSNASSVLQNPALRNQTLGHLNQALSNPDLSAQGRTIGGQFASRLASGGKFRDDVFAQFQQARKAGNTEADRFLAGQIGQIITDVTRELTASGAAFGQNIIGNQGLLASSGELLDLLGRIQSESGGAAGGGLEVGRARESSFIDIGQQGLFSLGRQVRNIRPENLTLPGGLGVAAGTVERTRSFQERQADSLEELIEIQKEARALLAVIAAGSDNSSITNPATGQQGVLNVLNDLAGNTIGGAFT